MRIETQEKAPPDFTSGGVINLTVSLVPQEPLVVRRGWIELYLLTTRFSRTVLDGYLEHTTKERRGVAELCKDAEAQPGEEIAFSADIPIYGEAPRDAGPTRLQWRTRARFRVRGFREIRAEKLIPCGDPAESTAPAVDGRGFLPLYEFRTGEGR